MIAKYASSGSAIRTTSHGSLVILSPCSANSTTIVNNRPYRATGPMRGRKRCSYHSTPLVRSPIRRVRNPATSGMPRNTSTTLAISHIDTSSASVSRPSQPGSTLEVEPSEHRERSDLEQRVDRHQHGRQLAITAGEVVPDQHHRDAACQADDDQTGPVLGEIGQEQPGEREHQTPGRRPS